MCRASSSGAYANETLYEYIRSACSVIIVLCLTVKFVASVIAATQSRESLPEIVVDHERPVVDGSTAVDYSPVDQSETSTSTSTQKTGGVPSPSNEYNYVLRKIHHHHQQQQQQQQQHHPPGRASPVNVSKHCRLLNCNCNCN